MTLNLTSREKRALVYAAAAGYGYTSKGAIAGLCKLVFTGLLVGEIVGFMQEQKLFSSPETMNGYFRTGGKISGQTSETHAKVIRRTGLVT